MNGSRILKKMQKKTKEFLEASGAQETMQLYENTSGYPKSSDYGESNDAVSDIIIVKAMSKNK